MSRTNKKVVLLVAVALLYAIALWEDSIPSRDLSAKENRLQNIATEHREVSGVSMAQKKNAVLKSSDREKKNEVAAVRDLQNERKTAVVEDASKKQPVLAQTPPSSVYMIQAGDTLWKIARKFYPRERSVVGVLRIQEANPQISPRKLPVGTKLLIPFTKTTKKTRAKEISPYDRPQYNLPIYHKVVLGDNFHDLASRYYRDAKKWLVISDANPGLDPCNLQEGTKILIPLAKGQR